MVWTPEEWWSKEDLDFDSVGQAFRDAGLPFLHWENRVPLFEGEVDYELVQEIAEGDYPTPSPVDATPEPDPEPDQANQDVAPAKKGGWPKGKPRGKGGK